MALTVSYHCTCSQSAIQNVVAERFSDVEGAAARAQQLQVRMNGDKYKYSLASSGLGKSGGQSACELDAYCISVQTKNPCAEVGSREHALKMVVGDEKLVEKILSEDSDAQKLLKKRATGLVEQRRLSMGGGGADGGKPDIGGS